MYCRQRILDESMNYWLKPENKKLFIVETVCKNSMEEGWSKSAIEESKEF